MIVDEIGRDVSSVEFHAFNELNLVFEGFALTDGDNTLFTYSFEKVSELLADLSVSVCRDGRNTLNLRGVFNLNRVLLELLNDGRDSKINALLHF